MAVLEEGMISKIKNIFIKGQQQGLVYPVTLGYITGNVKGYQRKNVKGKDLMNEAKIFNNILFSEGLTIQMIKKFVKTKNIDLNEFIKELEPEEIIIPEKEESEEKEMIEKDVYDLNDDEWKEKSDDVEEVEELADVEEEFEEENQEEKTKTKKAQKLEAKIDELCAKCAEEKNLFKIHLNQFRIKGLIAKLQKELDKQNIKAEYDLKREELAENNKNKEKDLDKACQRLGKEVNLLKSKLRAKEEFDYRSKRFIYPKSYVDRKGGIDEIVKGLQTSDDNEDRETAESIKEAMEIRKQLMEKKKEQDAARKELDNLEIVNDKAEKKLQKEEIKSLIVKNHNPFKNIKNWFSNAFSEINAFFADIKEDKEEKAEKKMSMKEDRAERKMELKEAKAEMKRKMKENEENYKKYCEEMKTNIKKEIEEDKMARRKAKIQESREKMGIKVSEEQLKENDDPEQHSSDVQEKGDNPNQQDVQDSDEAELGQERNT